MKLVFIFTIVAISGVLSAQPYESIFGKNFTIWNVKWSNLDFGGIDTIYTEKDTIVNNLLWKKIISFNSTLWVAGLIREDTVSGKVWYSPLDYQSDTVYLAFDFSLEVGDTFNLSNDNFPEMSIGLVDSTFFVNNNKTIQFNTYAQGDENVTFIEGVGGNQGPIYKDSGGLFDPYLLCAFKDGIQTYANISYEGNCNPPTGIDLIEPIKEIEVYPNPVDDVLNIKNYSELEFKKIEIFDALGRKVSGDLYQRSIDFNDLMPGLYYIRLITIKGQIINKPIIRQ